MTFASSVATRNSNCASWKLTKNKTGRSGAVVSSRAVQPSYDFGIEGWEPDKTVKLPEIAIKPGGRRHQHIIYLWRVRETGD